MTNTAFEPGTTTTFFEDVGHFHQRFDLPCARPDRGPIARPRLLDEETFRFRLKFLKEEIEELEDAHDTRRLDKFADALVDLVYVALGTAHLAGVPFEAVWREVHAANMKKVRATSAEQSKRGSTLDVVKPPSWQPPDVARVLIEHGWAELD